MQEPRGRFCVEEEEEMVGEIEKRGMGRRKVCDGLKRKELGQPRQGRRVAVAKCYTWGSVQYRGAKKKEIAGALRFSHMN